MANDGKHVWIGNNEDEDPSLTYRLWYFPAFKKEYGYMLWSELTENMSHNSLMFKNPQGGMNEYGLFLDYTAIDVISAISSPDKKDREEQIVTDILKQCKTVKEALQYISKFNLNRLTGAQLFIGDAGGDYATVHGSYIVPGTTRNFTLTNYSIKDNHHEACWRRDVADHYLKENKNYHLNDITAILEKTAQKKPSNIVTNYSMAVDLKTKTLHLYYKNDFRTPIILSLDKELKKGNHYKDMADCFPHTISDIIIEKYTTEGIDSAIASYRYLRKNFGKIYNFRNNDALDLAIQAIANGQTKDAIDFLECLKEYDPKNIALISWLGVAYRKDSRIEESNKCFSFVLNKDPDNYIALLFGQQKENHVTFLLNDFEGAERVFIICDYSKWIPIPMEKKNGKWICQLVLPIGEYNYKFMVNDQYLADQINLLYTGSGPYIYSKLYVW
jgi:tetratricopeptide (TPR) repeat protein